MFGMFSYSSVQMLFQKAIGCKFLYILLLDKTNGFVLTQTMASDSLWTDIYKYV